MRKQLLLLREKMKEHHLKGYLIPTTDYHGSEYVNPYFKCREYISGFTGSEGTLLVMENTAYLWTDGRYFLQAKNQLAGSGIKLMKMGQENVPDIYDFLETADLKNGFLGVDGRLLSLKNGEKLKSIGEKNDFTVLFDFDLVGDIWLDRPELKGSAIFHLPELSITDSIDSKLSKLRTFMLSNDISYHLITKLEEIAWLFNLRGNDILYTPVFYSYAIIGLDEIRLYVKDVYSAENSIEYNFCQIHILNYDNFWEDVKSLSGNILLDGNTVNYQIVSKLPGNTVVVDRPSPCQLWKATKSQTEIKQTKAAHIKDGVAMVKFLYWIKSNIDKFQMTELDAAEQLERFRAEQIGFIEPSFDTISAYGANGAIIHYSPSPKSNSIIEPQGFYLLDSGGQYLDGTTDITRTIAMGPLTREMKEQYTAVLKGNIDLTIAEFPVGTKGIQLDSIARNPILDIGYDYLHGTGHGVGHVLCVHEGPNVINSRNTEAEIHPGMVTSNEPGIYREGFYGIRLENEMVCVERKKNLLGFEVLTLCPFEKEAIISELLSEDEREFLNIYHEEVYQKLKDYLAENERIWLREVTRSI